MSDFCYLEVLCGPQAGAGVVLDEAFLYEIGSGGECHLVLEDPSVEASHAQLYVEQGQLVLVPVCGETRVNEHLVEESVYLEAGDELAFGEVRLSYEPLALGADPAPVLSDTFHDFLSAEGPGAEGPGAESPGAEGSGVAALAETGIMEGGIEGEAPTFFDMDGSDEWGEDFDPREDLPELDLDHQAVVERLRLEASELRVKLAGAEDRIARLGAGGASTAADEAGAGYEARLAEAREQAEEQAREISDLQDLLRAFGSRARREHSTLSRRNQDLEARVRQLSARCQSLANQAKRTPELEGSSARVPAAAPKPKAALQAAPRRRRGAVSVDSILDRAGGMSATPKAARKPAAKRRKGAVSVDSILDRAGGKSPKEGSGS